MRIFTVSVIILFLCKSLFSQNISHEFGKISGDEFLVKIYDKDTAAEAVILYDIGKTSFVPDDLGFNTLQERRVKYKILSSAGLKYAEFSIPFYTEGSKKETVFEIMGNTYNLENNELRTTKLNEKNTYIEKVDENWRLLKFAMPDVKEGSVYEVSYKIIAPTVSSFITWKFQNEVPVIYNEFSICQVPFIQYSYKLQGAEKVDKYDEFVAAGLPKQFHDDSYKEKTSVFIMNDIPAFRDETFMSCKNDYIIKIDFQLIRFVYTGNSGTKEFNTSWPVIVDDLLDENESFGKYLRSCQNKAREILDSMHFLSSSTRDKAEEINNFVKKNFLWNGERWRYASKSSSEFLKDKSGNCADINLFLTGILNAAGIETYPLLISTRHHGKIKTNYPSVKSFDYVLAYVKSDSLKLILDATEPLSNFREIPPDCLNETGLIVCKGEEAKWLKYSSTVSSSISARIELYPEPEKDSILETFRMYASGYDALKLRKKYVKDPVELKKSLKIDQFQFQDTLRVVHCFEPDRDLEISFSSYENLVSEADNSSGKGKMTLNVQPFASLPISENPLKQPERKYPIDLGYRYRKGYVSTIHIPRGFSISSKPTDLNINNENVKIRYLAESINDSTIRISGSYDFKKDVYDASLYRELKEYFSTIVDKFNDRLTMIKP
jgi:hypothetical protein